MYEKKKKNSFLPSKRREKCFPKNKKKKKIIFKISPAQSFFFFLPFIYFLLTWVAVEANYSVDLYSSNRNLKIHLFSFGVSVFQRSTGSRRGSAVYTYVKKKKKRNKKWKKKRNLVRVMYSK